MICIFIAINPRSRKIYFIGCATTYSCNLVEYVLSRVLPTLFVFCFPAPASPCFPTHHQSVETRRVNFFHKYANVLLAATAQLFSKAPTNCLPRRLPHLGESKCDLAATTRTMMMKMRAQRVIRQNERVPRDILNNNGWHIKVFPVLLHSSYYPAHPPSVLGWAQLCHTTLYYSISANRSERQGRVERQSTSYHRHIASKLMTFLHKYHVYCYVSIGNAQVMFRKSYGIVESLTMMIRVRLWNYTAMQGWTNYPEFLFY